MSEESEFGKGFIYNLILFAKHYYWHEDAPARLWFDAAADHFIEFEIPEIFIGTEIGKLAEEFSDKCLELKSISSKATEADKEEAFKKLERLAMLIDKELGIEDIKARYR